MSFLNKSRPVTHLKFGKKNKQAKSHRIVSGEKYNHHFADWALRVLISYLWKADCKRMFGQMAVITKRLWNRRRIESFKALLIILCRNSRSGRTVIIMDYSGMFCTKLDDMMHMGVCFSRQHRRNKPCQKWLQKSMCYWNLAPGINFILSLNDSFEM